MLVARRLATTCSVLQRTLIPLKAHYSEYEGGYSIPRDKVTVKFIRSGGPGGQNVNKLNTKAFIKFHVASADWLSDRVKTRLQEMFSSRINQAGEMSVASDRYRTQHRNLDDALSKLASFIEQAGEEPGQPSAATVARVKALKRKADKLRRTAKKYHSDKKHDRTVE